MHVTEDMIDAVRAEANDHQNYLFAGGAAWGAAKAQYKLLTRVVEVLEALKKQQDANS